MPDTKRRFTYTWEQLERLLFGIYNSEVTPGRLPKNLVRETNDFLQLGVDDGNVLFGVPDPRLTEALKENIFKFSSARVFTETYEMSNALVGENGELRSFNEFKKVAEHIHYKYCGVPLSENANYGYLTTEYNTAVGQTQSAQKWREIEKNKIILPYLRYDAVGDENTCAVCGPLDNITLPVIDSFWTTHSPCNHFQCRCVLVQLEKEDGEVARTEKDVVKERMAKSNVQEEFKFNPGIQREVFSTTGKSKHPYFMIPKEYIKFAKKNFNLAVN